MSSNLLFAVGDLDFKGLYFLFAVFHSLLLLYYIRSCTLSCFPIFVVSVALVYDNIILALGGLLNNNILLILSKPRFFMHLAFTPLLAGSTLSKIGQGWWGWLVTIALIGLGFGLEKGVHGEYVLMNENGVTKYSKRPAAPPFPAILTTFLCFYAGYLGNSKSLIGGSIAMFILAAFHKLPILGQFGEVLIMWGVWEFLIQ